MRTVIIKVDSKEAEYIERLDYERGFATVMVTYISFAC